MSELKGLGIGGKITPSGDSSNTFPTHEDIYGFGGYMVAPPKSDDTPGRKLIAWERLKVGMLVYDDGTIYKCITKNQQPQNKATNNATWEELKLGNDLDNLEIGGRNLLTGTSKELKQVTTNNYGYNVGQVVAEPNATYTYRAYVKVPTDSTVSYGAYLTFFTKTSFKQFGNQDVKIMPGAEGYTTITAKAPADATYIRCDLRQYDKDSGKDKDAVGLTLQVKKQKLEKGNKATDWTPAPEDLHTAVTDGEYPLLMKGDNVGEGYYDSEVKLNTSNNTISANISGYAKSLYEFYNSGESQESSFDPNKTVGQGLCLYHCLNSTAYKDHWHPDWQGLGTVFSLGCPAGNHLGQFAFDYSPSGTNHLFFRAGNSSTTVPDYWTTSSNNYGWKRIAWADDDSAGYLRLYDQTQTGKLGSVNNIVSSGFYKVSDTGTTTDLPCNVGYGPLIVHGHQDTKLQIYANYSNSDLYFRAGTLNTDTKRLTSTWKKVVALSDLSGQIPNKAIKIEENSDLNNITTPGFYYCPLNALVETLKNCPTKLAFSLRAYKDANSVNQIVTVYYANARMYFRGGYIEDQTKELKWSSWKEIAYCQDYVKKSGDTMSGNLSIQTPTSPTLTLGSSTITYNKTTGCLEIMA